MDLDLQGSPFLGEDLDDQAAHLNRPALRLGYLALVDQRQVQQRVDKRDHLHLVHAIEPDEVLEEDDQRLVELNDLRVRHRRFALGELRRVDQQLL